MTAAIPLDAQAIDTKWVVGIFDRLGGALECAHEFVGFAWLRPRAAKKVSLLSGHDPHFQFVGIAQLPEDVDIALQHHMIFVNGCNAEPVVLRYGALGCGWHQGPIRAWYLAPELIRKVVSAKHTVHRAMESSSRLARSVLFNRDAGYLVRKLAGDAKRCQPSN